MLKIHDQLVKMLITLEPRGIYGSNCLCLHTADRGLSVRHRHFSLLAVLRRESGRPKQQKMVNASPFISFLGRKSVWAFIILLFT